MRTGVQVRVPCEQIDIDLPPGCSIMHDVLDFLKDIRTLVIIGPGLPEWYPGSEPVLVNLPISDAIGRTAESYITEAFDAGRNSHG